uniref:GTP-binding protein RHO1-like n=1 Tax=Saccoglossus kowalevskii TaxID=10224 RepID=A0ABM0MNE6_SACKO|nr:PREDICTED: GTP-binding protein RHO1-like [Saccoglossus kowalevskii]
MIQSMVGDGNLQRPVCKREQYWSMMYIVISGHEFAIFESCVVDFDLGSSTITLSLHDISGQEDYESMRNLTYADADAFVVCYDVSKRETLKNAEFKWLPEIRSKCGEDIPFILVGCKADLRQILHNNDLHKKALDLVSIKEVERLAARFGAYAFFECSAKYGRNVRQVFEASTKAWLDTREDLYAYFTEGLYC